MTAVRFVAAVAVWLGAFGLFVGIVAGLGALLGWVVSSVVVTLAVVTGIGM